MDSHNSRGKTLPLPLVRASRGLYSNFRFAPSRYHSYFLALRAKTGRVP